MASGSANFACFVSFEIIFDAALAFSWCLGESWSIRFGKMGAISRLVGIWVIGSGSYYLILFIFVLFALFLISQYSSSSSLMLSASGRKAIACYEVTSASFFSSPKGQSYRTSISVWSLSIILFQPCENFCVENC